MSRIAGIVGSQAGLMIAGITKALAFGAEVAPRTAANAPRPGVAFCATSHNRQVPLCALGGVTVAIDGAIYNRDEFQSGATDAETFAELYRRYGFQGALVRVNGAFAIAVHDSASDTLWFARDRLGIKPLYYARTPHLIAFSSRPRALLSLPGVNGSINVQFAAVFAGSHYRYIDNRPEDSPYAGVHQAQAGHWYSVRNGTINSGRYWALEDVPDFEESEKDLAAQYRELLLDAVAIRVRDAERAAFTLSGGMDSSSVLACAHEFKSMPQIAYSTVYTDKTYDESLDIRSMLEDGWVTWNPVPINDPDVFDLVRQMVAVHDEPVATATWLSHFILCREIAGDGYKTLFGGLGGDELNAGEYEYFFYHFADLRRAGRDSELDAEICCWAHHHDHPIWRKNADVAFKIMASCTDQNVPGRCIVDESRMWRYSVAVNRDFFDLKDIAPVMEAPFDSYLKTRTYQDLTRETAPCCLRAEDRHGAAFGLSTIDPFFDHRVIEFMFRVPGSMKIREGITKRLLREAMRGLLPESTRTRIKKTGWNAPAHLWFSGMVLDKLLDMVNSRSFRERGVYNVPEVNRLIGEHRDIVTSGAQRENHMMFLWQLLNLELWLQQQSAEVVYA